MSDAPFRVAPLDASHDRSGFDSGSEPLNRYFLQQATQDIRRRVTACFVALAGGQRVAGYYTLGACRAWGVESENRPQRGQFLPDLQAHSPAMGQKAGEKWTAAVDLQPTIPKPERLLASSSVLLADLPAAVGKKLPRYPSVPAVRMGRLAVDLGFKGQGLGAALLADALDRAARSEIAAYALVVDAKDEAAAAFYQHHGFIALPSAPMTLFLPLSVSKPLA